MNTAFDPDSTIAEFCIVHKSMLWIRLCMYTQHRHLSAVHFRSQKSSFLTQTKDHLFMFEGSRAKPSNCPSHISIKNRIHTSPGCTKMLFTLEVVYGYITACKDSLNYMAFSALGGFLHFKWVHGTDFLLCPEIFKEWQSCFSIVSVNPNIKIMAFYWERFL